jgi:hypothetical protein
MRIALGKFSRSGIEACLGVDIEDGARTALRHYVRRYESASPLIVLPGFCFERSPAHPQHDLELTVEPEVERALAREASVRGGVSAGELAAHAILAYLAEIDEARGVEARPPALL